ncbi:hypothetical protein [Rhodohalobacter mucosus]|uniref:TolB-like 6-blade propeller-like n=1 Tax=Rhodohalobacter mucosus TaxID=2079485 RepID=A0A316TQW6_9BACT|nr:hypothetical protein [Rhodohalobacter mucosus]PWN05649.1 hypothetical protein DDZ15_13725 [Rhodohalobacter mucosus]
MKNFFTVSFFILLAGCSEERPEFQHFLDGEPQDQAERIVTVLDSPVDILNFSDFDIYSPGTLEQNSTHLFLIDFGSYSIIKLAKENFQQPETILFREGSGPGELQSLQSIAAGEKHLYAGDPRQRRIVVTDTDGNHIRDIEARFSPDNLVYVGEDMLLNYDAHQQDNLFTFYDMYRDSMSGFEEIEFGFSEVMKYPGYLSANGSSIYFSGYSEPLLRKYSINGELLFSRKTIDNFDTSDQYEERTMGDNRIVTFSDDALFSAIDVSQQGEYLYVIPYHNGNKDYKYIDLYSSETGRYVKTYTLEYYPRKIITDENFIHMLVRDGEDNLLVKYRYPNP